MTNFFRRVAALVGIVFLFLSTSAALTGCACGIMDVNRFGGSASCNQQMAAEREAESQKRLGQIPGLHKRADSGDIKAQIELASFHVFEHHPQSNRALGLSYYQKAAKQGDLHSQRIYVTETYQDCYAKTRSPWMSPNLGPQFAPLCEVEWSALETLAKQQCARSSENNSNVSLAALVGGKYSHAGKLEDADLWIVAAMIFCIAPKERASSGDKALIAPALSIDWRSDPVRAMMWLQILGPQRLGPAPPDLTDLGEQPKKRLAMLREKVTRLGIRPEF